MHTTKKSLLFILLLLAIGAQAQTETIQYELNGRNANDVSKNPFGKYVGEWSLSNDNWTHNWGGETETIKIPGHHTITKQLNTNNSLLSIIDGPEPNGQIYWSYNPNTKEVHHLSSFGAIRAGNGKGKVNDQGDVELKLVFEGEPKGTYRIYNYKWIDQDTYHMKSVQYGSDNEPTGLFYEGTFVRIKKETEEERIKAEILANGAEIRKAFAEGDIEKISALHHPNVVKALGYEDLKLGRKAVVDGIKETLKYFTLEFVENEVENILIQGNTAIEQTRFAIKGTPKDGGPPFIFKGRTMVTYLRYDQSPTGWATIREIIQPAPN